MNLRSGTIYFNPNNNTYQLRSGNFYVREVESDNEDVDMISEPEPDQICLHFMIGRNKLKIWFSKNLVCIVMIFRTFHTTLVTMKV